MEQIKTQHTNQPFFVVNDEAYNRMMKALRDGEKSVKSYLHVCPHKRKQDCNCEYYENYLDKEGMMVRKVGDTIKPVLSLTMLQKGY
jgi:hypothetical protein